MKLSQIDLNLLLVFHQLLIDRRVSTAATSLGLSQPAASNALRRLRQLLGDALFLRTPHGMEPTPYALQLAEPVALALGTLHTALNERASFDPATSSRAFTLAMTDVGEVYFLPVLMDALARTAPGVTLRAVSVTDPALKEHMASGQVDLALGLLPQLQAGFFQQVLFHQPYVCLMRNGHALATRPALSLADFKAADHVQVESAGTGHSRVDEALQRHGLTRRIRLTLPHFVALGHVLASTDLIATVPERYAQRAEQPFGLTTRPLPVTLPASAIHQFWHARLQRDPGCQWLRALVASTFGADGS
ncbi:MAG: LysR family transcriptional regulator [Rhodoferax sp.]|nr:LysR family transcriptional regulator [Rhodoferax sp.]